MNYRKIYFFNTFGGLGIPGRTFSWLSLGRKLGAEGESGIPTRLDFRFDLNCIGEWSFAKSSCAVGRQGFFFLESETVAVISLVLLAIFLKDKLEPG